MRRLSLATALAIALSLVCLSAAGLSIAADTAPAQQAAQAAQSGLVNINTASAEQLTTLDGIGEKIASDIVAYRQANGPFATVEGLLNVKGIGEKKFEAIKSKVTVK